MAGGRDTPAARLARDAPTEHAGGRLWVPANTRSDPEPKPVIVDPEPANPYGRRRPPGERRALVASAARIDLADRKAAGRERRRRQAWQSESWDYVDEVPEYGYTIDFVANLMSKVRLFPAVRPDPKEAPIAVDDPDSGVDADLAKLCLDTLARLRSPQGGQSGIVADIAFNFEVAGDCSVHGHVDATTGEEEWNVRSVDELTVEGDEFVLRQAPGSNVYVRVPKGDLVFRLWMRHRRFGALATCPARRILGECESVLLLSRELRSTSKSRLGAGLLLVPQELGLPQGTRAVEGEEAADRPFDADLMDTIVTPIQQEGSAAAVAPTIVTGAAEFLKPDVFRRITFDRPLDAVLDTRIEARVMRIARGLNQPVEVTTGLQETTFANASQVKKSEWDAHGEPRAVLICDALTASYFQWALEEAGVDRQRARDIFVWFDPSDAISAPDPVDHAEKDHEDGIISDQARRRAHGWSEADAPDDAELVRRLIFHATRLDPFLEAQLLVILGLVPNLLIPAPSGGVLGQGAVPAEGEPAGPVTSAAVAVEGKGRWLGRLLAAIDRDLRTRTLAACEAALRRALERAGNRVRSAAGRQGAQASAARAALEGVAPRLACATLGPAMVAALGVDPSDMDDEFDEVASDFGRWVRAAQAAAVAAVAAVYGPFGQAALEEASARMARSADRGADDLKSRLVALATTRVFDAATATVVPAGEADPSAAVPAGLVRAAMAVAGGGSPVDGVGGAVSDGQGGPAGGVALGIDVLDTAGGAGGGVEGYVWEYGAAPRTPFPPHEALDGTTFANFDDDALTSDEGFPETGYLFPGDHAGCQCDAIPVMVDPASEP